MDLSQETADLLSQALELCALTDGALDLTAYSQTDAEKQEVRLEFARPVPFEKET